MLISKETLDTNGTIIWELMLRNVKDLKKKLSSKKDTTIPFISMEDNSRERFNE